MRLFFDTLFRATQDVPRITDNKITIKNSNKVHTPSKKYYLCKKLLTRKLNPITLKLSQRNLNYTT